MKYLYDQTSYACSAIVTKHYSTSFALASRLLGKEIRPAIYAIYGFVRYADEIVDTFHDSDQEWLLERFEQDFYLAIEKNISLNPILHAFTQTVKKYNIDLSLVEAFLDSMRTDLYKKDYTNKEEYENYIYGSADVVGLMCLKVFVNGDADRYEALKNSAMKLGSAFQKVNFLRDLRDDTQVLERSYFPYLTGKNITAETHQQIINEIEQDFREAFIGIKNLPKSSRLGVYTAYRCYLSLLKKIKKSRPEEILRSRFRVSNAIKIYLLGKSLIRHNLNMI